jgi:DNA-binding LacI/PurR family transcriptional regulator
LPAIYRRDEIDGVLAISDHLRIGLLELLRSEPGMAQKPIVGVVGPGNGTSTVRPDDYDAGYQAMSHLLDLGHRVTMVVRMKSPSEKSIEGFRTRGIVDACIERGLDPDTTLVDGGWTFKSEDLVSKTSKQLVEEHAKIIIQMIKERPEITAIVAPNDGDAQWIYWALRRSGIRIPEDISMVSFDDTEAILDDQGNNMLTTVRLPLFDVGEESAKLLIQRIRGEVNKDREIVLPVELIVRGSTSSPSQRA